MLAHSPRLIAYSIAPAREARTIGQTGRRLARRGAVAAASGLALSWSAFCGAQAQVADPPAPPASLKTVATPEPKNLNQFLRVGLDGRITPAARAAAVALGKLFFWDQAAGSDGQACASCHFSGGADNRAKNQLNPGFRAIPAVTAFTAPFSANLQLKAAHFPFTRFASPLARSSGLVSDTPAIVASQGVFNSVFNDVRPGACPTDLAAPSLAVCDKHTRDISGNGAVFNAAKPATALSQQRNVEPRNTPTVVNAVFNHRNFWDNRARNEFNGVNPFGDLDPYARVLVNSIVLTKTPLNGALRLENAALASQAVGPSLSDLEMSAQNRNFAEIGKKLLAFVRPLQGQIVAADDSVLGDNPLAGVASNFPQPGVKGVNDSYRKLIQAAFQDRWHKNCSQIVTYAATQPAADKTVNLVFTPGQACQGLATNQFNQMEFNFSLFWGIALQMYEATLRADDSPFDKAFDSGDPLAFSLPGKWGEAEKRGVSVFVNEGKCVNCHSGPELTNASVRNASGQPIETMAMADGATASYDDGAYNIAVRKCKNQSNGPQPCDDVGLGGVVGPLNLPISIVKFAQLKQALDPRVLKVCAVQKEACSSLPVFSSISRVAVDGAFKAPSLRNVELTAPYFHNGGELTLTDVVNFYDRGGNFPEHNIKDLDPDIGNVRRNPTTGQIEFRGLNLTAQQRSDLVAFMKALTDDRLRYERKPFDHPQLFVPNLGGERNPATGAPLSNATELPAVGQKGRAAVAPVRTFAEKLAP